MKKAYQLFIQVRSFLTPLGLLLVAILLFYFSGGLSVKNLLDLKSLEVDPASVPPSQFNGWIAWWDENNAAASLNKFAQNFVSISPVWYRIDEEGKLQKIPHQLENIILSSAQRNNIKVLPTITNDFDPKRISHLVNNSDLIFPLFEELATLATSLNYQGFDIDWEEIDPKDQQAFSLFINKLSEYLHTYSLTLTVSVHPQTGQASDRNIAEGYKLTELAQSADAIKIMAYDFHNPNSKPGAITPLNELKKVLDYTVSMVPKEKIIFGLPTYGYDWEVDSNKAALPLTFTQASEIVKKHNGQTTRDPDSHSLVGTYEVSSVKHVIWFVDAQTIAKMIEQARRLGVYQFSFWRIGAEDPDLWTKLLPPLN